MTDQLSNEQIVEVLCLFDDSEGLWWRNYDNGLKMFARCSDFFVWGCADLEEITPDTLETLQKAHNDLKEIDCLDELDLLFSARVRGMRPQGAYYKYLDPKTWSLFDECGPEREVGVGNPIPHPESGS